ncbi:membrane protein [Halobellus salinus]|uniref:Membrane protein n=1 Tax=Halobellus salinus TaxID=931585 RepID=A0A830EP99_9EURY|nr:DMT family transporter [Halobellus salinus]GGJ10538.1 membrane protein [Halobellus salinus]SMP09780.1 Threonine/homoserine efflux transporter RhtA [Halobellus salinus]
MTSQTTNSPAVNPEIGLGVSILAISTSAILINWSRAPAVIQAFYRVAFTTLLLAPLAVRRHADSLRSFSAGSYLWLSVPGVLLAIHFALWFESLDWTSVAASVTLVQSQPLFVALGATLLLDERFSRRMLAGVVVATAGTVLLSLGDLLGGPVLGAWPLYGNALALASAVALAAYIVAGRSFRQRLSVVPYVTVVYTVCAIVLLAVAVINDLPLTAYPPREWLLFAGMAVGPGVLGHTVLNWSLGHLESGVVSVTLLAEPVGSAILAYVLLDEVVGPTTAVGGAVVLAGIYFIAADR